MFRVFLLLLLLSSPASWAREPEPVTGPSRLRPVARTQPLPLTRWAHVPHSENWTRGAINALRTHGAVLVETMPRDIEDWCPAYATADVQTRANFWVGFLSALAKHESTYNPRAVGGGGKWYGLLQILPATARGYGCTARSGQALKNGAANLSCAIRIMAVTVPRDGVIAAKDRKWRGVAADWGPMQSRKKRRDIANWTRAQSYCSSLRTLRPQARKMSPPPPKPDDL